LAQAIATAAAIVGLCGHGWADSASGSRTESSSSGRRTGSTRSRGAGGANARS